MNYGLYLSASGVLTNLYRQDVFANNLANVETVGFKPDLAAISQRDPETVEDALDFDVSNELLEKLGGGVLAGPQRIDFQPGAIEITGNPHDVALTDRNSFFAIQHVDANTGQTSVRLSRDGRFTRHADGTLIQPNGHAVLDPNDRPIIIDDSAPFTISDSGEVIQNGEAVAQVQVANIADTSVLHKEGENLFGFGQNDPRQIIETPRLETQAVETSAANPIHTLMRLTAASKAAMGNARMIQYQDLLMDRAINTLGRVA